MYALRLLMRREVSAAWRYRWAAVAVAWVICLGGWAYTWTIPNQYEASARLYVDADAVLTPLLRGLAVDNSLASQLDVLQRTLLSRPNLEKLVSKTDLDLQVSGPADLEGLVASLGTSIRIVPQTRNLFTITYRNSRPKLAYDVVQAMLTTFIESKTGNNRTEMEGAQSFLQQQIDSYERQLRAAEKKRADFRTKYIDLLPADGSNGVGGLDGARNAVRALQGELTDALASRTMLATELAKTPPLLVLMPPCSPAITFCKRGRQCVAACAPISMPIQRRPILCATAAVVPEPRKESRMRSPGLDAMCKANEINSSGFGVANGSISGNSLRK